MTMKIQSGIRTRVSEYTRVENLTSLGCLSFQSLRPHMCAVYNKNSNFFFALALQLFSVA